MSAFIELGWSFRLARLSSAGPTFWAAVAGKRATGCSVQIRPVDTPVFSYTRSCGAASDYNCASVASPFGAAEEHSKG